MTKGQRAMAVAKICFETKQTVRRIAVAMVYPEAEERGRWKKAAGTKAAESAGFSRRLLEDARTILKHAPDLGIKSRSYPPTAPKSGPRRGSAMKTA